LRTIHPQQKFEFKFENLNLEKKGKRKYKRKRKYLGWASYLASAQVLSHVRPNFVPRAQPSSLSRL
jgi:stalled ribosome alternative rescue factor ArfA